MWERMVPALLTCAHKTQVNFHGQMAINSLRVPIKPMSIFMDKWALIPSRNLTLKITMLFLSSPDWLLHYSWRRLHSLWRGVKQFSRSILKKVGLFDILSHNQSYLLRNIAFNIYLPSTHLRSYLYRLFLDSITLLPTKEELTFFPFFMFTFTNYISSWQNFIEVIPFGFG